ncbi:hypothetical protein Emag_005742 [Eimeria magna]
MTFSYPAKLRGICLFAFVLHGASAYQRVEAHRQGRPTEEDDLHLQIASETPIESAINALDCVSDAADQTLKRNTLINSQTGGVEMMDADAIRAGQAEELNKEADLHDRRAQEIEGIKNQQKSRHAAAMKEIQESKEMRLQQQSAKHKSKQEIAALMEYPLLGFSMPSTLNPVEYLSKLTSGTAAMPKQSNAFRVAANPRTVGASASRSHPQTANSRGLQDQVEILGDDALLDEVVKKKRKPSRKQHATKHKKEKPSRERTETAPLKETTTEDEMDDDDDDEESGAAKVVQKLQDTVAEPFQDPVFSKSTKHSDQQRGKRARKPTRIMRDSYKDAETDDAFAAETTVDEGDDEITDEEDKAGQNQSALAQQALLQRQARATSTATRGSNRINAAITSARARFAASRGKADAFLEHDDDDEANLSQDDKEAHRSDVVSDAGAVSELEAQETPTLATEQTEAAAEASAAEKEAREAEASLEEENKLLAAEKEADQAKNGLKTCAGGSFLNCRQESKGARPQRSAGARLVR